MKPETLKKKRLAFLEDTVNHYNINNRCEGNMGCKYSPYTVGLEGKSEGCAIGRKLGKRTAIKLDKDLVQQKSGVFNIFDRLPKYLQQLGMHFLSDLQSLHDHQQNWDEIGISEEGINEVALIKSKYELV